MKVKFIYDRDMDVWCLLNKGKSSKNSSKPTAVYEELVSRVGETPDEASTAEFISEYLKRNNLKVDDFVKNYQERFDVVSQEFEKIAERVFGAPLDREITAYLTINSRCPYSIEGGWLFVSIFKGDPVLTVMHELWHFYTWERFGQEWQAKLGKAKYNDIKEALTVLLNTECKHLLPEEEEDKGYPQHQELRGRISELWQQNPDIEFVWREALEFIIRLH